MEVCGWKCRIIDDDKPSQIFLDVGGLGIGIYDRLVELGHRRIVTAVNYGGQPVEPAPLDEVGNRAGGYVNRRSEMYGR